ncbi:transaldolase family protein [Anaerorhabdus sp.]|uniref:transaldolase family protein n=1 Tax=Anaerorhabdus sp. TaxID=1872524 RepID=UPI002B2120A4|nr:transaldolase family protein [Anaerorhabdus sp.]MEA4876230.1 transaldolase family protein [Anaerorhabdus sp.]
MNKLLETTKQYPMTEIWNDSCSVQELKYCIENGGVGATTNPVIVLNVLKKELPQWENQIKSMINENPQATEDEIAWDMIKLLGKTASKELYPIFNQTQGKQGRISFQTNAKFYRNKDLMVHHAIELASTVENSQIKAPTSKAGVEAFEEMTYRGISINATVSFTVSQAIAVAEAVERGLNRRIKEGLPIDKMNPVCTIMAGRVDDYLKKDCKEKGLLIEPEILEWAGVAVVKNAYRIYQEKAYRTTLLVAAYRNPYHWNQFIGGKIVLTIPYDWQLKYNTSSYTISSTIDNPVCDEYLQKLQQLEEFNKAYLPEGLLPEEFEHYGAFLDTMNQFLNGYDDLCKLIRKYMVI